MALLLGTKREERPLPMALENAGTLNTRPQPIRTVFQRKSNPKSNLTIKKPEACSGFIRVAQSLYARRSSHAKPFSGTNAGASPGFSSVGLSALAIS